MDGGPSVYACAAAASGLSVSTSTTQSFAFDLTWAVTPPGSWSNLGVFAFQAR